MKLSALRYSLFAVRQKVVIASEDVSLSRKDLRVIFTRRREKHGALGE